MEVSIEVEQPAAMWLVPKLEEWANEMWQRFGEDSAVYLVGSSLTSSQPRDVDISIVLPDARFSQRYGDVEGGEKWSKVRNKMTREIAGLVPSLCRALGSRIPPDLKVMSEGWQDANHRGQLQSRLDSVAS